MITITISGYGQYQISSEKLQELLNWLARNQGVQTQTNEQAKIPANFYGKSLITG